MHFPKAKSVLAGACLVGACLAALASVPAALSAATPAKQLFGNKETAALLPAEPLGSYAKGCIAGAEPLIWNGPNHQVMRIERNRFWGHPSLISYLEKLAERAVAAGWPGLLIGDLAQPRGGPMLTGHASHQIGLDADIWLMPMPDRTLTFDERKTLSAVTVLTQNGRGKTVDPSVWSPAHVDLLRTAASFPEVARIFVNPAIKVALCEGAGRDRAWLRKIRPWWGHHYHFHVRLSCPDGAGTCSDQAAPPPGDGCAAELASWFKPPPKPVKPAPAPKKRPELTLADLPQACAAVLDAD